MKLICKSWIRDWMPPAFLLWLHRWRKADTRFEGDFSSWGGACSQSLGYDSKNILDKVLHSTLMVKAGEAAFERDSVVFEKIEYVWPVLASLMWIAARNRGRLNILDFGGGLGSAYFQNIKFLREIPELCWSVVEQEHYVEAGQEYIQDEQLRFYKSIEECLSENEPNVVLLSSVLQYVKSPFEILDKLAHIDSACLIIDRTPFSNHCTDRITIQQVPSSIYSASYPMWIFSKEMFLNKIIENWVLVASNMCSEGCAKTGEGFDFSFQGMLLKARR